jgi:hypothetical protein
VAFVSSPTIFVLFGHRIDDTVKLVSLSTSLEDSIAQSKKLAAEEARGPNKVLFVTSLPSSESGSLGEFDHRAPNSST